MKISLTFDNGPYPQVTSDVLDILAARKVPATFFAIGTRIEAESLDILRRARSEGHRIGNHTWHHAKPFGVLDASLDPIAEIDRAQALLRELGGDMLFRPTAGGMMPDHRLLTPQTYDHLCSQGYTMVLWDNVPRDWEEVSTWPEIAGRQAEGKDWTVVVIHDMPTGAMAHLSRYIDAAQAAGHTFESDFPDACVPVRGGVPTMPVDHLMTH